ncbi:tetratricopeptide repeat protein [Raineyella fluvialis]|uniref:Tetratricopeptide repeat protein n=1 Tax=Raineyella fluvialis TaxID=2662261 RepID=A0A5Q2FBP0_9ACTN|nr:tetratricopeptide repeat protein [Raineyella fluvialis]QGF24470.1 tetratricopeptide repeat protein [Raineyella fluvialis]
MTNPTFNRPGAVDLSALPPQTPAPGGRRGTRNTWVVEVDETTLEATIRRSLQYPVVLELTSARAQGADQLSADLAGLANAAEGRWLLARVDCDAHPQIAAALQIQAVPTVMGLLSGQAVPLFQGVLPHDDVASVIDQLLQAALANGVAGRAEPIVVAEDAAEVPARDARYSEADEAMGRGDFAAAEEAFDALLRANPADSEARIGKAQAGLWARAEQVDPEAVTAQLAAAPRDPETVLAAADLAMVQGRAAEAFDLIIRLIRTTYGDDREPLRRRLLDLFETVDPADPTVTKARRDLANALF